MLMIVALLSGVMAFGPQAVPTRAPAVVFVCEHGAAKSVIATAYFNKIAAERGLPFRATFRGTTPQDDLSVRTVAGDDEGYAPMRNAIVRHVTALLDELQAKPR